MRTILILTISFMLILLAEGSAGADFAEGPAAYERGDYERALALWKPLAERGERDPQLWLGVLHEKGEGVKRDYAEAHKWYALAWKRDHPEARKRALGLRKRMTKQQFQDSRRRIRAWIKDFAPHVADGVAGPDRGGIGLKVKEVSRRRVDGYMQVCYAIELTGHSANKKYRFSLYDLGMFVERDRETVFPHGVKKMDLCLWKFRKGEWSTVSYASRDGTQKASTTLIPFPLEAKKDGARIWLQLSNAQGLLFLLQGEGFKPNEELTTVSRSNGEEIRTKKKAQPNGRFAIALLPAAARRQHKSSWTVIRESGTKLTIDYEWGPAALKLQ